MPTARSFVTLSKAEPRASRPMSAHLATEAPQTLYAPEDLVPMRQPLLSLAPAPFKSSRRTTSTWTPEWAAARHSPNFRSNARGVRSPHPIGRSALLPRHSPGLGLSGPARIAIPDPADPPRSAASAHHALVAQPVWQIEKRPRSAAGRIRYCSQPSAYSEAEPWIFS